MRDQFPTESRAAYMLRVAAEYIKKNCPESIIVYDEEYCDGYCVAEDCESAADGIPEEDK